MSNAFQVGDTVALKSGGPVMTVTAVLPSHGGGGTLLECSWFEGVKHHEARFPGGALEKVDPFEGAA